MSTSKKGGYPNADEVAERLAKGWKAVPKQKSNVDRVDAAENSDSQMPPTETLKEKWFGSTVKTDAASVSVDDSSTANVVLQSGPLEKTVGVSNGKILWRQG